MKLIIRVLTLAVTLLCSGCASDVPVKEFVGYDSLGYPGKPDLSSEGLSKKEAEKILIVKMRDKGRRNFAHNSKGNRLGHNGHQRFSRH